MPCWETGSKVAKRKERQFNIVFVFLVLSTLCSPNWIFRHGRNQPSDNPTALHPLPLLLLLQLQELPCCWSQVIIVELAKADRVRIWWWWWCYSRYHLALIMLMTTIKHWSSLNDGDDDGIAGHGQLCLLYLNHWKAQEENVCSERRKRLRLLSVI